MLKVISIFGTRPEAIKMAPIIREMKKYPQQIKSTVIVTAQHREMLDQVLKCFAICPNYDMDIMKPGQSLFDVTANILVRLKSIIEKEAPNIVLVQGDTTTAFTASLASFYSQVMIGHVEAGLRTGKKYSPFPEEINRSLISVLSDLHFAPTLSAKNNLLNEGIDEKSIYVTGNTVIDALLQIVDNNYTFENSTLSKIDFHKKVILVTAHRRENHGKPLENICHAIADIVRLYQDVEIIYPVHLNPKVSKPVQKLLENVERVHLIEPLEYEVFVQVMNKSYLILTDSGGIQEEAPSLGKPVLVLRDNTERPEAMEAGTAKIAGTDRKKIVTLTRQLLEDRTEYKKMSKAINPYGDGKAAERIVNILTTSVYKFIK